MADSDDKDWQDFLNATELDDDDDVETSQDEDENLEDDDEGAKKKPTDPKKPETEAGEEDDAGEGDDPKKDKKPDTDKDKKATDDGKKTEDDADTYKPRLTQFFNDEGKLDPKKIEEAYIATSKEGVRLKEELDKAQGANKQLLSAIAADPEVAKKILGEEGAAQVTKDGARTPEKKDPILADYEAKLVKQSHAEYDEFIEQHPEAVSDPEKAEKIGKFLKFYGPWYQENNNGEIAGMKDSLEAAYRQFGWDLEIKEREDKASAAKKAAATRSTSGGGKKPASKNALTKSEQFFATKLGVKL